MTNKPSLYSMLSLRKRGSNAPFPEDSCFRRKGINLISLNFLVMALLFTMPARAEPATYSPEGCEFAITFPGDPYKVRRCNEDKSKCYDLVSYTKVYEFSTTVNFRVICTPSTSNLYDKYSGEVMEATLKALTKRSVVKTFDTTMRTEDNYKQAGLIGEGLTGLTPTIYIAQLWVGKASVLSVEAELIGDVHDDADAVFSDILKSVEFVDENAVVMEDEKAEAIEEGADDTPPAL